VEAGPTSTSLPTETWRRNHLNALATCLWDYQTDFCDLIVSVEQAEMSQRSVIGAILVVSGLAVSFLLWLLYMHHASADFAGRWMFLPTLNALLNGSCAIALCGVVFHQTSSQGRPSHEHAAGLRVLFRFSRQLYREPRTARRHDFPRPWPGSDTVPFHFGQPRNSFYRRVADGADDVLFLADGPVRDAPPNRTLDVPCLVIRFDHWRRGFRFPQGICVLGIPSQSNPQNRFSRLARTTDLWRPILVRRSRDQEASGFSRGLLRRQRGDVG